MSQKIYFTPGPSQLYPGVDDFIIQALKEDVCSISHRSQKFQDIYKFTIDNLKSLINLPDNYKIFFLGSATEAWERIFNNLVQNSSYHFVNGSFSEKFHEYGVNSGIKADILKVDQGFGFDISNAHINVDNELIAITQNETSSGVQFPLEDIYTLRKLYPNQLIAVDVVSSLPDPELDFTKIDSAIFSVQKCFGLPSGLGVWIVNDRCISKCLELKSKGKLIGPHHDLPELIKRGDKNQTPSTPNVLGIYLLGKVCESMLKKGIGTIRKETTEKLSMLNSMIADSNIFSQSVSEASHRSRTVVVANSALSANEINSKIASTNYQIGAGYGDFKLSQIRIANFPAHSVQDMEKLSIALKGL